MPRKKTKKKQPPPFIDAGRLESEKFEPSAEVRQEFVEAAQFGSAGAEPLTEKLREPHYQGVIEELGKAAGLIQADGEPLHTTEKIEARDAHRWELDPASSEGFDERMKHEGEYEEQ